MYWPPTPPPRGLATGLASASTAAAASAAPASRVYDDADEEEEAAIGTDAARRRLLGRSRSRADRRRRRLADFNVAQNDRPPVSMQQWDWLESSLNSSTADWIIVVGNHPVWSAGAHGPTWPLAERLAPLLEDAGVSLYISGIDPIMQHIKSVPAGSVDYLIVGNGASFNESQAEDLPNLRSCPYGSLAFQYGASTGFLGVLVTSATAKHAASLTVTFYDDDGNSLYTFSKGPIRAEAFAAGSAAASAKHAEGTLAILGGLFLIVAVGLCLFGASFHARVRPARSRSRSRSSPFSCKHQRQRSSPAAPPAFVPCTQRQAAARSAPVAALQALTDWLSRASRPSRPTLAAVRWRAALVHRDGGVGAGGAAAHDPKPPRVDREHPAAAGRGAGREAHQHPRRAPTSPSLSVLSTHTHTHARELGPLAPAGQWRRRLLATAGGRAADARRPVSLPLLSSRRRPAGVEGGGDGVQAVVGAHVGVDALAREGGGARLAVARRVGLARCRSDGRLARRSARAQALAGLAAPRTAKIKPPPTNCCSSGGKLSLAAAARSEPAGVLIIIIVGAMQEEGSLAHQEGSGSSITRRPPPPAGRGRDGRLTDSSPPTREGMPSAATSQKYDMYTNIMMRRRRSSFLLVCGHHGRTEDDVRANAAAARRRFLVAAAAGGPPPSS